MIQTIQKTGKFYKAAIALGQCSILIGTPVLFFNHRGAAAAVALLAGATLYIFGKAGAWWNHG
jgi:hypothetical protein